MIVSTGHIGFSQVYDIELKGVLNYIRSNYINYILLAPPSLKNLKKLLLIGIKMT